MKNIDLAQLAAVSGGASSYTYCRNQVSSKADKAAGADGTLNIAEARGLISSVQNNGFFSCERAGMRDVLKNQPMTTPAADKVSDFLTSLNAH